MSTINVLVSQGSDKHQVSIDTSSCVGALKDLMYEKTGIPVDAQKLIFKGRNLQDNDEVISSSGLKEGSRLMLIGRKVDPAHDEHMKSLEDVSGQVSTAQRKLNSIEIDLEGMEKGFLNRELIPEKCAKLEKQCLSCNESLMRLLERLDSVVPSSSDTQIRRKRKSIVTEAQDLLLRTDQLSARIKDLLKTV